MKFVNDSRRSVWSGKTPQELCDVDRDIMSNIEPEDPDVYSTSYTKLALQWKQDPNREPVADSAIIRFYYDAVAKLKELAAKDPELDEAEAVAGFDRMWPKLSKMLEEPAFYRWVQQFAMDSSFIYTYFVDLSGRAPALEMSMGYTWDVTGRYRKIPKCDTAGYYMRGAEPTFRSFCQRNWASQQAMLKKAIELGWSCDSQDTVEVERPRKVNLLFLGGGLLPQLRFYDLDIETASQMFNVVVYDKDPDARKRLEEILGRSVEEYGIEYHCEDYNIALEDPQNAGKFDVVLGTGMMSYCETAEGEQDVCNKVYTVLVPGGHFACDYQVKEPSMVRCVLALQWRDTGLQPKESADVAVSDMRLLAEQAGFVGLVSEVDIYNDVPAIVNFSMKKPSC